MPDIDDVIDTLGRYAALLELAVDLTSIKGVSTPYLPSWRAVRSCEGSLGALHTAILALEQQLSFTQPLVVGGRWFRPIDLVRHALRSVGGTALEVDRHQRSRRTPEKNRRELSELAERAGCVAHDLSSLLSAAVEQISFPHLQHA